MSDILIGDGAPKALNDLARLRLQEIILRDLVIDLTICKIEEWDSKEYIGQLKKTIDDVYYKFNQRARTTIEELKC